MNKLERLLAKVAIEAPLKRGKYSRSATIDWRTVEEIREALDSPGGFDWRKAHKHAREVKLERAKAAYIANLEDKS